MQNLQKTVIFRPSFGQNGGFAAILSKTIMPLSVENK